MERRHTTLLKVHFSYTLLNATCFHGVSKLLSELLAIWNGSNGDNRM